MLVLALHEAPDGARTLAEGSSPILVCPILANRNPDVLVTRMRDSAWAMVELLSRERPDLVDALKETA